MKKFNMILRKCRSLSAPLGRSYSYSSLQSKSTRLRTSTCLGDEEEHSHRQTIFVGSTRKRYEVSARHLKHPLLNALIEKKSGEKGEGETVVVVKCEVVLFDHLLWMLENVDQNVILESLEELAELYLF